MDLVLFRSALASPSRPDEDDAARALTSGGQRRCARVVRGIGRAGLRFDRLLHSPLLRGVQTADLLASRVDGESMVTPLLAAAPDASLLALLEGESVAVVGHSPFLEELAGLLLLEDARAGRALFDLRHSGWLWLRGQPALGGMSLRAHVPPRLGRAIGERA